MQMTFKKYRSQQPDAPDRGSGVAAETGERQQNGQELGRSSSSRLALDWRSGLTLGQQVVDGRLEAIERNPNSISPGIREAIVQNRLRIGIVI